MSSPAFAEDDKQEASDDHIETHPSKELAEAIGITEQNLSILKTGKAKAIRLETLNAICDYLSCQPGDILEHRSDETG